MVMAGLLVTDELSDIREELEAARNQAARDTQGAIDDTEDKIAGQVDSLAARIEIVREGPDSKLSTIVVHDTNLGVAGSALQA